MGKATGFMEFERKTIANRDPIERLKDWNEIHLSDHTDDTAESARVLSISTPQTCSAVVFPRA